MTKQLLESGNVTFNLNTLGIAPEKSWPVSTDNKTTEKATSVKPERENWQGWNSLLAEKLKDNSFSSGSDKEFEFFKDFLEVNYPDIAKKLLALGEPFIKTLRVLGLNPEKGVGANPILGFVTQEGVRDNLLNTGLLNSNTFRAIYNAIANKQVAHSQFFEENEYNIIYCKDLYTKAPSVMAKYLDEQKDILDPSATHYTSEIINNNKRAFFVIDAINYKDINKVNLIQRAD